MLNYIIWNIKPQLFDFGSFEIRYYSLLFALGFIAGYFILIWILKRERLNVELLDKLTIYVVLSTIIGARLGHCLFYEFDYYIQHPLEIILPWRGTPGEDFQFTGFQGLASHGGAIGILLGIYLFSRKTKTHYLWSLDRLAIVVALAACFIRTGNLMNSEIYGNPTKTEKGFVFTHDFNRLLTSQGYSNEIEKIKYVKTVSDSLVEENAIPLELQVTFSRKTKEEIITRFFAENHLKSALSNKSYQDNITHPDLNKLNYHVEKNGRNLILKATVFGIPRYPTQIYEALSYLIIFLILLFIYYKKGITMKHGFYLGLFLVLVFTARFFIEFLKENQEVFENSMALNMGQILSIPFIAGGIALLLYSKRKEIENKPLK